METTIPTTDETTAADNWARYQYGRNRGHDDYVIKARELEGMYLGGGLQWSEEDKEIMLEQGRVLHEFNEIAPAVNAAIGYQIHNRMDITFKPRAGAADEDLASVRSKIAMQIADNQDLHWKETDVFTDGLIEQRGYFDLRIDYEDSVLGELAVDVLDPRDVIPDPDAKDYSPDKWNDVIITRWLTLNAIEQDFGTEAMEKIKAFKPSEFDFGEDDIGGERNRFGDDRRLNGYSEYDAWRYDSGMVQVRVIDRQKHIWAKRPVGIYPTGDVRPVKDDQIEELEKQGVIITERSIKLVERTISTRDILLYQGDSEFPFLSVVPYFPYFRRGKTRGLVDNGLSPQQAYNKLLSQYIHIINSTANSGWMVEENSLTNMDTDDLEDTGASTGLVVEYKQGSRPPEKIQPNQIPQGVDRMIERSMGAVRDATVPEVMRGTQGAEVSGVAIQSKQFASQQQLAIVLDNLARTRNTLAKRIDWAITHIYDSQRIFRIVGTDQVTGKKNTEEVAINMPLEDGTYHNDMTAGEYDVVISEQPMQVTFENSQFTQALEMREKGIAIDDKVVLRYSNLADKFEIIDQIAQQQQAMQPQANPIDEAKAEYIKAQTEKERVLVEKERANVGKVIAEESLIKAQRTTKSVEGMFSAMSAGKEIVMYPGIATIGDSIYQSAGGEDANGYPIAQAPAQPMQIDPGPSNTSPNFPQNPQLPEPALQPQVEPQMIPPMGSPNQGIESGNIEGL